MTPSATTQELVAAQKVQSALSFLAMTLEIHPDRAAIAALLREALSESDVVHAVKQLSLRSLVGVQKPKSKYEGPNIETIFPEFFKT